MRRTVSLYFVRHAQASHNIAAEMYGDYAYYDPIHTDSNLTEMGVKQSVDLQYFFKKNNPDIVYSSSLRRCLQTLDNALIDYKSRIHVDDRLAERLGEHPCNKRTHKNNLRSHIHRELNIDNVINDFNWLPKRETDEQMIDRCKKWYFDMIEYVKQNDHIERVAIFSHYDFLITVLSKGLPFSSTENSKPFNNAEVREIKLYL